MPLRSQKFQQIGDRNKYLSNKELLLLFLNRDWGGSDDGLLRQLNRRRGGGGHTGFRDVEHGGRRRLLGGHGRRLKEESR